MNKKELIREVSLEVGMPQNAIAKVVTSTFNIIANTLAKHEEEVSISGFGKFSAVYKDAKEGRNPQTGEIIEIEARYSPKFKPSSNLKEMVK